MIIERLVLARVVGWTVLAAVLIAGLAGLAWAVEAAQVGPWQAVVHGVAGTPAVLVALSPTLVAAGAAAAAARMESLGERVAMDTAGVHPARAVAAAVVAGALLGAGQLVLSDQVVWRAEAVRQATLPVPEPGWVWLEGGALRPEDGVFVGQDLTIDRERPIAPEALQAARMRQQPWTASGAALRETELESARLERHSRRARAVLCAGLAGLAWLPVGPTGLRRLAALLLAALAVQALDAAIYAAAAQGQLGAAVGGWAVAGAVGATLVVGGARLR